MGTMLSREDVMALLEIARQNGTEFFWPEVARQWMVEAESEIGRLRTDLAAARALLKNTHDEISSVTCDPEGTVCIRGSDGDRKVLQDALAAIERALTEKEKP